MFQTELLAEYFEFEKIISFLNVFLFLCNQITKPKLLFLELTSTLLTLPPLLVVHVPAHCHRRREVSPKTKLGGPPLGLKHYGTNRLCGTLFLFYYLLSASS